MSIESRKELGRQLQEAMQPGMSDRIVALFAGPASDFGEYTNEFLFGEIWQRPGLDLHTREIAVLSALIANRLAHELRVHLPIAVNLGVTRSEIIEVILQLSLYIGLPAAGEALAAVREVLGNGPEEN